MCMLYMVIITHIYIDTYCEVCILQSPSQMTLLPWIFSLQSLAFTRPLCHLQAFSFP